LNTLGSVTGPLVATVAVALVVVVRGGIEGAEGRREDALGFV
jgi:type IV secretory pathway VirB2 component (pilin)